MRFLMSITEKIKKYFENIKDIEMIKAEYRARGQEEATARFITQQKKMTDKIEELTEQNIAIERRLRNAADQRVERMEQLHNEKCTSCRHNLEEERQRLQKRQSQLAKKINEFEDVWIGMYQHANTIIDEHDTLIRSSGRLIGSRNVLDGFRKRFDNIIEQSVPLLSVELQDSSRDKTVDAARAITDDAQVVVDVKTKNKK